MRVTLRIPAFEDVDLVVRGMQDAETMRWLSSVPVPYGRQDAIDFIGRAAIAKDRCILVDGEFAGLIRTGADLGYWVAPEYRGKGVARQAAQRALMAHFQESSEPAHAWHFLDNKVSRKVLRSVGFRDDGETMMDWQGGAQMPAMMMRMSAEDFADALEVRTRRCQITRMREEDLPELHRIVTNPEVAHMLLRFSPEMTVDEVGALLRPAMNPLERPMRMAIRHEGKCIGSIGVNDGPWPLMFYFLAPEYWGQGFASEIVPEFCDAVQDWFGLEELIAAVFNDNLASRRILEKAGFHVDSTHSAKSAGRDAVAEGWLMRRVG